MSCQPSREVCFMVLQYLHAQSGSEAFVAVKYWQESQDISLSLDQTQGAIAWLQENRLLRLEPEIQVASLTHLGVAAVERAFSSPDSDTSLFPALSTFYGLGGKSAMGLCKTTLRLWLDQLGDCSHGLALSEESHDGLGACLSQLEHCVSQSTMDPASLELGLMELKASL